MKHIDNYIAVLYREEDYYGSCWTTIAIIESATSYALRHIIANHLDTALGCNEDTVDRFDEWVMEIIAQLQSDHIYKDLNNGMAYKIESTPFFKKL